MAVRGGGYQYPCGTNGAYQAHLYRREPPCSPCRAAHALKYRAWYRQAPNSTARKTWTQRTLRQGLTELEKRHPYEANELRGQYPPSRARYRYIQRELSLRYPHEYIAIVSEIRRKNPFKGKGKDA